MYIGTAKSNSYAFSKNYDIAKISLLKNFFFYSTLSYKYSNCNFCFVSVWWVLNFDFLGYNITGFIAYAFFNIGLYWIDPVWVSQIKVESGLFLTTLL